MGFQNCSHPAVGPGFVGQLIVDFGVEDVGSFGLVVIGWNRHGPDVCFQSARSRIVGSGVERVGNYGLMVFG